MNLNQGIHYFKKDDVTIAYEINGQGPILFIHTGGPGIDPRSYKGIEKFFEHFTTVVVHPRGAGLSSSPQDGYYALDAYTKDLEDLRKYLGIKKMSFLGHSHGGMVGMMYAIDYAETIENLFLCNVTANDQKYENDVTKGIVSKEKEEWYNEAIKYAYLLEDLNYDQKLLNEAWNGMLPFYFGKWTSKEEEYRSKSVIYEFRKDPLIYFNKYVYKNYDIVRSLNKIKANTVVIAGEKDIITNVEAAKEIVDNVEKSKLYILKDVGHMSIIESPSELTAIIFEEYKKNELIIKK